MKWKNPLGRQNLLKLAVASAHAKILHIDTTKAKRLPGVKAIASVKEKVPKIQRKTWRAESLDLFLDQKLRYTGEEVVAVAAVDEDTAEEALELIKADYEVLPPVTDPEKAIEPDAPKIHEGGKDEIVYSFNYLRS